MKTKLTLLSSALIISLTSTAINAKDALQFKDIFNFKSAKSTQLSEDGSILSLSATPYRGNATGQVYSLSSNSLISEVERGTKPVINKAANWVAFTQVPTLLEKETSKKKDTLKNNVVLVNTLSGEQQSFADVKDYKLSDDGAWLAYRLNKAADKEDDEKEKVKALATLKTRAQFHQIKKIKLTHSLL